MTKEWLIVGGGIHGVHLAARLIGEVGIEPSRLAIVDPGTRLLARWRTCTETTGMRHLRSPAVHHLDLDPWSLKQFASKKKHKNLGRFAPPYERPALALFNAHCDAVIENYGLDELHIQARATGSHLDCDGVRVSLSTGETVTAHHLVLAIGGGEAPEWPSWVPKSDPRVSHVFSVDFDAWPTTSESILVVGGGISAGQVSLRLAQEGHQVHLVSRHPLRQHQFDSEPGWLGPRFMKGFSQVKDADQRRAVITDARHKGSVPPDVWRALRRAFNDGQIRWHESDVDALETQGDDMTVHLASGESVQVHRYS